jgi:hypothetical protein
MNSSSRVPNPWSPARTNPWNGLEFFPALIVKLELRCLHITVTLAMLQLNPSPNA